MHKLPKSKNKKPKTTLKNQLALELWPATDNMKLGILLSPGDSLARQQQSGQLERLTTYYLKPYSAAFNEVYLFSYGDQKFQGKLPKGITLVTKPWSKNFIKQVDVWRVFQAVGGIPVLFSRQPAIITYGYDYPNFALLEGKWLTALAMKLVLPLVLRKASKIIVTTKDSLPLLGSWQKKAVLIPNGVDPQVFKPGKKRDPWLVLSVGRLVKQKNYQLLIETISNSQFKSQIKLVIIGVGPMRQKLLNQAKKLKVNLKIVDNLPYGQLVSWYQKAAIFALTSSTEGQSKALLEALSCGCACLTTQFSGNPLAGYKPQDLPEKLDKMLSDDKLKQQLGIEGRQLIIKEFNLTKLIKKEIALLKLCI